MSGRGPFADRLIEATRAAGAPLCVGLDPFPELIPALFGDAATDPAALSRFCAAALEACADRAAAIKPQLGLFEAFGPEGYAACAAVVAEARARGSLVILDAKRGDIGTTAAGYARATLGPAPGFDADAVTVNPYMGLDTLQPFLALAAERDRGVAVLVRTSNPGAGDLQDLDAGGAPVWARLAERLALLAGQLRGASGWSGLMAVAGATYPTEARRLRALLPDSLVLVPGFGAQGASAVDAVAAFVRSAETGRLEGGVVNSSRAVLYPLAAQAARTVADWRAAVREAAGAAHAQLQAAIA